MTLLSQTTEPTRSVTQSVEAKAHNEAIEAVIDQMAKQEGHELEIVEYEVTGPFSNLMRRWAEFPANAELYDVYLRWMA